MSERPRVLLIDDGDLLRIRKILEAFDVDLESIRGALVTEDLESPFDLVIGTVKQILAFEDKLDLSAMAGKPVWIAVHSQDFLPLRVRLRKMGVSYLVQSSVGSDALRLLVHHSLYQGPNRREDSRLPIGTPVTCADADGTTNRAVLLDLDSQGCRLVRDTNVPNGSLVVVELPGKLAGGTKLGLPSRAVRCKPQPDGLGHIIAVAFEDLDADSAQKLDDILQGKVIGTVVTRLGEDLSEQTASTTVQGSRSTATAQSTPHAASEPPADPQAPSAADHRRNRRVSYSREVTALVGGGAHAIMGRDLSVVGMRSDPVPELVVGTELELAIYGASGSEPVLVSAVVARDDGLQGTVFRFEPINAADLPQLERIIDSAREVHALQDDRPVVVAEVRPRR
jgi:hypothetical protein